MGWASEDSLTGLGLPAQQAFLVGDNPNKQAGTGTSQTGATIILNGMVELSASGGATNFILQHVELNMPVFVTNPSATTAVVNAPVGATLNGAANGTLSIATNKSAIFWEYKKGFWASALSNV